MSRATVRDGIAKFFGGTYDSAQRVYRPSPLIGSGLATVRAYPAKVIPDTDYTAGLAPGRAMGTVGVVHLGESTERRVAIGGATGGWKHRVYVVTLHLYHLSTALAMEDAQADLDSLLEAVVARIHGDRTLGDAVLQAGESTSGIRSFLGQSEVTPPPERVRTYASVTFDADVYLEA